MTTDTVQDLARQVRDYLRYMSALGVENLPRVDTPAADRPDERSVAGPPPPGKESLEEIRADLGMCSRCRLAQGRASIVFGEGPPGARLMFVGEGPAEEEDHQGRPFVGESGRLLTDIIVKGMKLTREDCYLAYVAKCRPPHNREPLADEIQACRPFLRRQIAAIRPRVICALGRVAAQALLATDEPLGRLRHRFHDFEGIPLMPTYHLAAMLREPARKRDVWEDIKLVMARLAEDD